jgi:hypothetical protein
MIISFGLSYSDGGPELSQSGTGPELSQSDSMGLERPPSGGGSKTSDVERATTLTTEQIVTDAEPSIAFIEGHFFMGTGFFRWSLSRT